MVPDGRGVPAATARPLERQLSATAAHLRSWDPDLLRQILLSLAAAACVLGPGPGTGAGRPGPTLLSPAPGAFALWILIDAGLVLHVLYQWLPSQRRRGRQRRLGWSVASALVLLAALRLSGGQGTPAFPALVSILLLAVLLATLRPLNRYPARSRREGAAVDVPLGLLLGWVLVEAAAWVGAAAADRGADGFGLGAQTWALLAVGGITVGAAVVCMTGRGHIALALAVSWGLGGIMLARLFGDLPSAPVAFAAGLGAFLLLISAGSRRHRVDHRRRRRLRAIQDAARPPLDLTG